MPRNGHSGRCFRDRRRTAKRQIRQGVPIAHMRLAMAMMVTGFFKSIQAAMRFTPERLTWMLRQSPVDKEGKAFSPKTWHRRMVARGI